MYTGMERAPHAFVNGDVGRITAARIYGVLKAMLVSMIEGGKTCSCVHIIFWATV